MSDLTAFLLARLDGDEGGAPHSLRCGYDMKEHSIPCRCAWPARFLAEVRAKRAVVERHSGHVGLDASETYRDGCDTLRHLAVVYVDHPDYREEWRP